MSVRVTGGFQYTVDVNSSSTLAPGPPSFGGGDTWTAVNGNSSFAPYMAYRGSAAHRRWDVSCSSMTDVRVNPITGRVYMGCFGPPGRIIELNPATNEVQSWTVGNKPYGLTLDATHVWYTGVAEGPNPDSILRLDPASGVMTRWPIPGGGLQPFISFGSPNSITKDVEGNIWATETAADQVLRLVISTNTFEEFAKPGVLVSPQAIASSGAGATLQAFNTEAALGDAVDVLTRTAATPVSTVVPPTMVALTPTAMTMVTPVDFTPTILTTTITPSMFVSTGVDGFGIDHFPANPPLDELTGMTRVAFPGTVFGSAEHSHDVFKVVSPVIIAPPPGALEVPLDVKPGSCPNPLNNKSQGKVPVAIAGTASLDVTKIDVSSVKLEGVSPLRSSISDVATPFSPFTGKKDCFAACTSANGDGIPDLVLHFDTQALFAALGPFSLRECRVVKLTGKLTDGTPFSGEDVVVLLK